MIDFWRRIWLGLINQRTQGIVGPDGYTITKELGSGYSVEDERMADVKKLMKLGQELLADPSLVSRDITADGIPETFCNRAAAIAAREYGFDGFEGLSANQLYTLLNRTWRKDSGERAAAFAMRGGLAFACKQYSVHGHIALVAPYDPEMSGSWGHKVPMVYNVGRVNAVMRASQAFPVADGECEYFLYGETA